MYIVPMATEPTNPRVYRCEQCNYVSKATCKLYSAKTNHERTAKHIRGGGAAPHRPRKVYHCPECDFTVTNPYYPASYWQAHIKSRAHANRIAELANAQRTSAIQVS